MKKKIVVLLLLILAGTWVFLSQNGWCGYRSKPGPGRDPWSPAASCTKLAPVNNPSIYNSVNSNDITIENSGFHIYIFGTKTNLQRGEGNLNRFQKEVQNLGQVNK
ncbi:MAG: hypothetical protein MUO85_02670 [candidate division Zixibacteria bacterium]|nr:hypothetical protein [candidate division Zixibacteria bacterium]